jgi:CRP-like cAMP-binding protein
MEGGLLAALRILLNDYTLVITSFYIISIGTNMTTTIRRRVTKKLKKGTQFIREGEIGDSAYLVKSGKLEVYTMVKNSRKILATLQAGEIFGEMALFNRSKRTASVDASVDSEVIEITREELYAKLKKSDVTIRAIVEMMFDRISENNRLIACHRFHPEDFDIVVGHLCTDIADGLTKDGKKEFLSEISPMTQSMSKCVKKHASDWNL